MTVSAAGLTAMGLALHPGTDAPGLRLGGGDRARIQVVDPATEEVVGSVPDAGPEDCLLAVDAAAAAAGRWASAAPRLRGEILRGAFDRMIARADELAQLITLENGKALSDARAEVTYAAEFLRWFSEEAVRASGSFGTAPGGGGRMITSLEPIGVCLLITPWNFPAAMITRKVGPALAAGCTCVLKPAGETPLTAYALASIFSEAGLPDGVLNVVTTSASSSAVAAMMADRRVRKLSFTGSTPVGKALAKLASDRLVRCSLELGGNAPFIVFADSNLDAAIEGALIAKLRNAGQACTAANRFYVQGAQADAFAEGLARRMATMRLGPGRLSSTELGPLINKKACDRMASLVDGARSAGAVQLGGAAIAGRGHFFAPTVLAQMPKRAELLSEEIFGPIAPVVRFDDEDEVVELANAADSGLASYVYSADLRRALRVASRIEAGMVAVNKGVISEPAAPFGGIKESGQGREGGHQGLLDFMETKYVSVDW